METAAAASDTADAKSSDIEIGGYTRFELELEFVQSLSNANYLAHLASQKLFDNTEFVAYLDYLQYWKQPEYAKFLSYPGPSLRALELLQQESFRKEIVVPAVAMRFMEETVKASMQGR